MKSIRGGALVTIVAVLALVAVATFNPAPAHAAGTGSLSGRVTFQSSPVAGIVVWLYTVPAAVWVGSAITAADGTYSLPAVAPGTYRLQAWSTTHAYPAVWYPQALSFATATDLVMGAGSVLAGRDIDLASTGTITGLVTHNGVGVSGMNALLFQENGRFMGGKVTDSAGRYTMPDLVPGRYYVSYNDPAAVYPANVYWRDQADVLDAQIIQVSAGATFTADQPVYTAAEQPVPGYTIRPGGPFVAVIGDSLTQQSTHAMHAVLDPIAATTVRGISLQRIDQLQPVAAKMAALTPAPDEVIIAAGNNDMIQARPLAEVQAALLTMIDTFPSARCVTAVTVSTSTLNLNVNAAARLFDAWLRGLPQIRANTQVIDWAQVRAAYLAAGEPQGPWTTDGLHLSPLGQQKYAELISEAVLSCGAAPAAISGSSFVDQNVNGLRDPGEPGLAGQTITLGGVDRLGNTVARSSLTAADGAWSVSGLRAGTYSVVAQSSPPLGTPRPLVGTAGGLVSGSGIISVVLGPGVAAIGYNFASPPVSSTVSGIVYADLNANGVNDAGEPGIERVTVRVTGIDSLGAAVDHTTTTAADGRWTVSLNPGVYSFIEAGPNGYDAGTATPGGFGGTAGVRVIAAVTVPVSGSAIGYAFGDIPRPVGSWASTSSSPTSAAGRSVAVAGDGTIAVTGVYTSSITLGSGPGAVTLTAPGQRSAYLASYDQAGALRWAANLSASAGSETFKVAIDATGSIVVAGDLSGSATLGTSPNQVVLSAAPGLAGFVASFSAAGTLRWAHTMDDSVTSLATGVAVDNTGAVWVTGGFRTSVVIGRVAGVGGTALTGSGVVDGFMAQYRSDGSFVGARALNSPTALLPLDIAVNPAGGATVVGMHGGYDFGPGFVAASAGQLDAFVVSVDGGANVNWARSLGGLGSDMAMGVAIDNTTGMVAVSGGFGGTVDMGGGQVLTATTNGPTDGFVLAMNAAGGTLWARGGGGAGPDKAARVSIGSGHVQVTGSYTGPAAFGPATVLSYGGVDGYVASYDLLGNLEWVRVVAGAGDDEASGVATAVGGDAVVVGSFSGPAAVMPGPVSLPLPGTGSGVFVARLRG